MAATAIESLWNNLRKICGTKEIHGIRKRVFLCEI